MAQAGEKQVEPGRDSTVVRWVGGAPGAGSFVQDGTLVETITMGSVSLAVSLRDTGWKMRADVLVANTGRLAFDVVPEWFHLESIERKRRGLEFQSPEQLARSLEKRSEWSAALFGSSPPIATGSVLEEPAPEIREVADSNRHIEEVALRATRVKPGENVFGAVFFERDRKIRNLLLTIPVGDRVFEFPFSISAEN